MKRDPRALDAALSQLELHHLSRTRTTVEAAEPDSRVVLAGGQQLVDFSSNDYLALARHPALAAAMAASARSCGVGSGGSHLVTGHGLEHEKLEEELAAFTGRERALLFSTGYMANLSLIAALAGRHELVLMDRLNHASLIDAALLSGARFKRYAHADAEACGRELLTASGSASVVATDGVFSMDGDLAPLPELARASLTHQAWLVVDDAHGLGVVGPAGRGTLEHFGLAPEAVPALMGTLGKAFGSFGAFVAGSRSLIEVLLQTARPYLYTTALPQPVAAAARAALRLSQQESWRRERVTSLVQRFRRGAQQVGVQLGNSQTPIQPVILGSAPAALHAQQQLRQAGFWVVAIRPPTVPRGTARLRIALSAGHTEAQVDALIEALCRVGVDTEARA